MNSKPNPDNFNHFTYNLTSPSLNHRQMLQVTHQALNSPKNGSKTSITLFPAQSPDPLSPDFSALSLEAQLQQYINSRACISTFDVPFPKQYRSILASQSVQYDRFLDNYQQNRNQLEDIAHQLAEITRQSEVEASSLKSRPLPAQIELMNVSNNVRALKGKIELLLSNLTAVQQGIDPEAPLEIFPTALNEAYEVLLNQDKDDPNTEREIITYPLLLPISLFNIDNNNTATPIDPSKPTHTNVYRTLHNNNTSHPLDASPLSRSPIIIPNQNEPTDAVYNPDEYASGDLLLEYRQGSVAVYIRPHNDNVMWSLTLILQLVHPTSLIDSLIQAITIEGATSTVPSGGYTDQHAFLSALQWACEFKRAQDPLVRELLMRQRIQNIQDHEDHEDLTVQNLNKPVDQMSVKEKAITIFSRARDEDATSSKRGPTSPNNRSAQAFTGQFPFFSSGAMVSQSLSITRPSDQFSAYVHPLQTGPIPHPSETGSANHAVQNLVSPLSTTMSLANTASLIPDNIIVPQKVEIQRNNGNTIEIPLQHSDFSKFNQHQPTSPTYSAFYDSQQLQNFDQQNIENGIIIDDCPYLFSHYQDTDNSVESLRLRLFFGDSFHEYCDYFGILKAAFDHQQALYELTQTVSSPDSIDSLDNGIVHIPSDVVKHHSVADDYENMDVIDSVLITRGGGALHAHVKPVPLHKPAATPQQTLSIPQLSPCNASRELGQAIPKAPLGAISTQVNPSAVLPSLSQQPNVPKRPDRSVMARHRVSTSHQPISAPDTSPQFISPCCCQSQCVHHHELLTTNIGYDCNAVPDFTNLSIRDLFTYAATNQIITLSIVLRACRHILGRNHDQLWHYLWKLYQQENGALDIASSVSDTNTSDGLLALPSAAGTQQQKIAGNPNNFPEFIYIDPYQDWLHDETNDPTGVDVVLMSISSPNSNSIVDNSANGENGDNPLSPPLSDLDSGIISSSDILSIGGSSEGNRRKSKNDGFIKAKTQKSNPDEPGELVTKPPTSSRSNQINQHPYPPPPPPPLIPSPAIGQPFLAPPPTALLKQREEKIPSNNNTRKRTKPIERRPTSHAMYLDSSANLLLPNFYDDEIDDDSKSLCTVRKDSMPNSSVGTSGLSKLRRKSSNHQKNDEDGEGLVLPHKESLSRLHNDQSNDHDAIVTIIDHEYQHHIQRRPSEFKCPDQQLCHIGELGVINLGNGSNQNPDLNVSLSSIKPLSTLVDDKDDNSLLQNTSSSLLKKSSNKVKISIATLCEVVGNINQVDANAWSPLLYAAYYGNLEVVKLLIMYGANISYVSPRDGASPFYVALDQHHFHVCDLLISLGVNLHYVDPITKLTPLMFVAKTGNLLACDYLIRHSENISLNTTTLSEGYTALCLATVHNHINIADMLIMYKADLNIQTNDGYTALMLACNTNNDLIADLLISANAFINTYTHVGITALVCAITQQNTNLTSLLLSKHANPNPMKHRSSITPLIAAVLNRDLVLIKTLITKYGAIVNSIDYQGRTALMHACALTANITPIGNSNSPSSRQMLDDNAVVSDIIKYLISQGAELNVKDNDGKTASAIAYEYGMHHIVRMLFSKGAKRYTLFQNTNNVLQLAIIQANKKQIDKILNDVSGNVNLHINMLLVHQHLQTRDPAFDQYNNSVAISTTVTMSKDNQPNQNQKKDAKQRNKLNLLTKTSILMDESDYTLLMYCIEKDSMILSVDYHNLSSKWYDLALLDRGQYNYLNFTNNNQFTSQQKHDDGASLGDNKYGITRLKTAKTEPNEDDNAQPQPNYYLQYNLAKALYAPQPLLIYQQHHYGVNTMTIVTNNVNSITDQRSHSHGDNRGADSITFVQPTTPTGAGGSSLGISLQRPTTAGDGTNNYPQPGMFPKSASSLESELLSYTDIGAAADPKQLIPISQHNNVVYKSNNIDPKLNRRSSQQLHQNRDGIQLFGNEPNSSTVSTGLTSQPLNQTLPTPSGVETNGSVNQQNSTTFTIDNDTLSVTSQQSVTQTNNNYPYQQQYIQQQTVHIQPNSSTSRPFAFLLNNNKDSAQSLSSSLNARNNNTKDASIAIKLGSKHQKYNVGNNFGWRDIIDLLLKHKADVNDYTSNGGITALMLCAKYNRKDLCKILLKEPFYADINARDNLGRSVLGYAKIECNNNLAEWLFIQGARD